MIKSNLKHRQHFAEVSLSTALDAPFFQQVCHDESLIHKVKILRFTAVQDVGKAIHPSYVEGQIQGGAVQGIGWALSEGYFYKEDGTMANPTFLDYRMPTCLDLPMIETILVEKPNPASPHGIRGVGEVPLVPPMAAIANAIYAAVGVRMTDLPMSPDRVTAAILEKAQDMADAAG